MLRNASNPEDYRSPAATAGSDLLRRALARARGGDRDALSFLYLRYVAAVRSYAGSLVAGDAADDLTHSVFAKLPEALASFDEHESPFSDWILALTGSTALERGFAEELPADGPDLLRLRRGSRRRRG